jgi:hypothetical protein
MEDLELWASPQEFAREVALALLQSRRMAKDEDGDVGGNQLSLF